MITLIYAFLAGFIVFGLAFVYIMTRYVGPTLESHRGKSIGNWVLGPHDLFYIFEYKKICLKERLPLKWYKIGLAVELIWLADIALLILTLVLSQQ